MRLFVLIPHFGHKNRPYLSVVLEALRSLPYDVTIEILSESAKDFGPEIDVKVGLPGRSPWTLPFAYKQRLLERRNEFDLYIYVEDDILVTETNIRAFLDATAVLPEELIAGFTRYERDGVGNIYYIDMFRTYHFVPGTVSHYGGQVFAQMTNEHSGCFMLTRQHLDRALASRDFLRGPTKGRYGLPETAATEPYTQCGLQKVICISRLAEFALHHLPNKYWKQPTHCLATEKAVDAQRRTMLVPDKGSGAQLFPTRLKIESRLWDKAYYSPADQGAIDQIPATARDVLSVGCGIAATEVLLVRRGHSVTAIPLDGIIASHAEENGIRVLPSDLSDAVKELNGATFDAILLLDVLQYIEDPVGLLRSCHSMMKTGGVLVIRVPHFLHSSLFHQALQRNITLGDLVKLGRYRKSGLRATSKARVERWLAAAGFSCKAVMPIPGERVRNWQLPHRWKRLLPQFVTTREHLVVAVSKEVFTLRAAVPRAVRP